MKFSFNVWLRLSSLALALAAGTAAAQVSVETSAICQELDAADVGNPAWGVQNFDSSKDAFVVCFDSRNFSIQFRGILPLFGNGTSAVSLDDLLNLSSLTQQGFQVKLSPFLGGQKSLVVDFIEMPLSITSSNVDALLGPGQRTETIEHVCKIEYKTERVCKQVPVEKCSIVYGRQVCSTSYETRCEDVSKPVQVCVDRPVVTVTRYLPALVGVKERAPGLCARGDIEKRSRVVYGRTIEEYRCCEKVIVYGREQITCSVWQTL